MTMFIPTRTSESYLSTPHDLHVDKNNNSVLIKSNPVTYKGKIVEKAIEAAKGKISTLWRTKPGVVGRSQFYFDRDAETLTQKIVKKPIETKEAPGTSVFWTAQPCTAGRSQFNFYRVAATVTDDRSWETWAKFDRSQFDTDEGRIFYASPYPPK